MAIRKKTPGKARKKAKSKSAGVSKMSREEESFVRGLLVRGDAARPDASGKLPPGATHEIVEQREGELPIVRRRRFSAV